MVKQYNATVIWKKKEKIKNAQPQNRTHDLFAQVNE
jgi:hypothetical protein